ncbi:MAG: hypothetical protein C0518_01995 [Opitutus sp.]|nr:hypothetical protein [Opitutus sp.]
MSKPTPPPSPAEISSNKLEALRLLISAMLAQGASPPVLPAFAPIGDPTKLALDCAANSVVIAESAGRLGLPGEEANNPQLAQDLWTASLKQIEAIQQIYGLPKMPFQNQPQPPG